MRRLLVSEAAVAVPMLRICIRGFSMLRYDCVDELDWLRGGLDWRDGIEPSSGSLIQWHSPESGEPHDERAKSSSATARFSIPSRKSSSEEG